MAAIYTFKVDIEVHDPKALHVAARLRALADGITAGQLDEYIGTRAEPHIPSCLQMLFDPGTSPPGTSIQQSSVE